MWVFTLPFHSLLAEGTSATLCTCFLFRFSLLYSLFFFKAKKRWYSSCRKTTRKSGKKRQLDPTPPHPTVFFQKCVERRPCFFPLSWISLSVWHSSMDASCCVFGLGSSLLWRQAVKCPDTEDRRRVSWWRCHFLKSKKKKKLIHVFQQLTIRFLGFFANSVCILHVNEYQGGAII